MATDPTKDVTWRSQIRNRVNDLQDDLARVGEARGVGTPASVDETIAVDAVKLAEDFAAETTTRFSATWLRRWASGSDVESAWAAIHRAEHAMLMILPDDVIRARLPDLRASVTTSLEGDGRQEEALATIDALKRSPAGSGFSPSDRARLRVIAAAVDATSDAAHSNIRNYRNWLLIVSSIVVFGLVVVAIAHAVNARFISIVETGPRRISADVATLEVAGALGGLLMAVFALIRLTVYSGPVALPLWQAIVRIPAGAVAGLTGAALLQGKLLTALAPQDRSGLLAYAFLFGAAPEIVLRFLDNKVNQATAAARPKNDPLKAVPEQSGAGSGAGQR